MWTLISSSVLIPLQSDPVFLCSVIDVTLSVTSCWSTSKKKLQKYYVSKEMDNICHILSDLNHFYD